MADQRAGEPYMDATSFTTAHVEVIGPSGVGCGSATGFFYKKTSEATYFVTNWHVVTGRDPLEPHVSLNGAVPVQLRLTLHRRMGEEMATSAGEVEVRHLVINDSDGETPQWLEHPEWRQRADLVVIPIQPEHPILGDDVVITTIEQLGLWPLYMPRVMQDVFILGFPWGLSAGGAGLPIYKRGSIASEPAVNAHSLPRLLVDCRTADGMSGGPVLGRDEGPHDHEGILIGSGLGFLGVYSGRLKGEKDTSEIGVVWRRDLIEEIIEGRRKGLRLSEILGL